MISRFHPTQSDHDKETTRIEAFSDGVIAIIITLLVFGIQVPPRGASPK